MTYDANDTPHALIERWLQPYDGTAPGLSLLVLKDGVPLVRRSVGRSDLAADVEAGPATNYRLASVSKQFTATAILLLAQDDALAIDDPVRRWLPSLPSVADDITLRHLLTHTSGLPDYEDLMGPNYVGQIRDAGILALLESHHALLFPPGSQYRYSNTGYALLALVVERASGIDFPAFLQQRIFAPLGMHDTLARVDGGPEVPNRAFGYSQDGTTWQFTDQSSTSAVLGDGGIYSNIDDLARWDAALYDDRLLGEASRVLAFAPHVRAGDELESTPYHYGFGWRVTGDGSRVWHTGESIGFRNAMVRWPQHRLTVAVLTNRDAPSPYQLARDIGELFLHAGD
ncbi:serine hydrolase [Xanthomonadaceae bacterium JHOS43]|nr:serine hydrolase [Xanthomonadaceae bacterium JHOS43]MCX7561975.1 serine hydrolase [Xanthomonadaceae bacterium XH05]